MNNLRQADDTVLIADSNENLQSFPYEVPKASREKGLDLKRKKTECMGTT